MRNVFNTLERQSISLTQQDESFLLTSLSFWDVSITWKHKNTTQTNRNQLSQQKDPHRPSHKAVYEA